MQRYARIACLVATLLATPARAPAQAGEPKQGGAAAPPRGEVYGNRYDFVPGDNVLVYDDFSDTDVGDYPAKWTTKGDGGGGNQVEVVEMGGKRYLKTRYQPNGQDGSGHYLRYPIKGDMPKKFTVEFDSDVEGPLALVFLDTTGAKQLVWVHGNNSHAVGVGNSAEKMPFENGIRHIAIAVSGTQVKVYMGGERVVADPEAVVRPIAAIALWFADTGNAGWGDPPRVAGDHQMITNFRMAEGGKDAKTMLAGDGRIVTHGILFDSGSDVIKPESGPTLRSIQALLTEDSKLRFRVEGHTDDQGGPKVNGPLSERRAAAVKAWLVKQGVAEARLEAKGLGATKPIDKNENAEGRANNRRVEFVKL
jgi:outer membrane protein OmpA-like peptidoglycan-associated protein